jgi:(E)-4-hydroxy-3-methylbut-2-enyl-diphosphate synthase
VGELLIGGNNPVVVQSMTNTDTRDVRSTMEQCERLIAGGCELIRVAVLNRNTIPALKELKERLSVPLVADIHFSADLAVEALRAGVDKVRINPGNIGGFKELEKIINEAGNRGAAIRIGINSGSVEKDLIDKYGHPTAQAVVESALRWQEYCLGYNFTDLIFSLKSSDVQTTIEACEEFSRRSDFPQHIGITEAGFGRYALIKSAAGLGSLLLRGIGDTIRISLTGDPVAEIGACYDLLKAVGLRFREPEIISCPTCGRIQVDLEKLVKEVGRLAADCKLPLRITVLGCAVNGPGEAREADIGVAGGRGEVTLYRRGAVLKKVAEADFPAVFAEELQYWERQDAEKQQNKNNNT